MHFRIDGDDFTRIARDFFLEERPDAAWRFITEGLMGGEPGQAEYYAKLILNGKTKLVGNETVGLEPVDDDAADFQKQARYIYAGRIRKEGRWWRPRAKVTNFGPEDWPKGAVAGDRATTAGKAQLHEIGRQRVAHYGLKDERVFDVEGDSLIFEPTGEPPHWWPVNRTTDAALKDFLAAGRKLELYGWSRRYQAHTKKITPPPLTDDDKQAIAAKRAKEDEEDRKEIAAFSMKCITIGAQVVLQAGDDTFELPLEDGSTIKVPRAPFENWALRNTSLSHLAPPWKCISSPGMKMPGDDVNHTDWVLGAWQTLKSAYEGLVKDASWTARFDLQRKLGNWECGVVVSGEDVTGEVGKDILVLSDLDPKNLEAVMKSKAVITQAGGRLAHLALVAMEHCVPILLVPDALTRYPKGARLTLSPKNGRIHTRETGAIYDCG
jgi:phosphohistidine swiveling domain-containing protein